MAKPKDRNPDQFQLRVFSQLEGGRSNLGSRVAGEGRVATAVSINEPKSAGPEDRAIYDAIVERYFSSDR